MATKLVKDVMTSNPISLPQTATVVEAAGAMRSSNIGAVLVTKGNSVCGIITDRDVVVRVVAEGRDPKGTTLDAVCSHEVFALSPDDTTNTAVEAMRKKAVRRLPVMDGGKAIGIISLGDLALQIDRSSALGDISAASPNR